MIFGCPLGSSNGYSFDTILYLFSLPLNVHVEAISHARHTRQPSNPLVCSYGCSCRTVKVESDHRDQHC